MRPTFKKKIGISRIPFQVGNSANSATFPQSRKITGPKNLSIEMAFCPKEQFAKRCHFYLRAIEGLSATIEGLSRTFERSVGDFLILDCQQPAVLGS